MRTDVLVTYDVNTETKEGRNRLRKVANTCTSFGQRVQYSVFECSVRQEDLEELESRLVRLIDPDNDSLRLYVLHGGRERCPRAYGKDRYVDFEDPLIV